MARSTTTRFGLQRWSADGDTLSRADFDTSNAQVELLGAIATQGVIASRPTAGKGRAFYYGTDVDRLSYDDGSTWRDLLRPGGQMAVEVLLSSSASTAITAGVSYVTLNSGSLTLPTGWSGMACTFHGTAFVSNGTGSYAQADVRIETPTGTATWQASSVVIPPIGTFADGRTIPLLAQRTGVTATSTWALVGRSGTSLVTMGARELFVVKHRTA